MKSFFRESPKSIEECFKNDDVAALKVYMSTRSLSSKNPFQQIWDSFEFEGETQKVSSAVIATHFRAIKCLQEYTIPHTDGNILTPLHLAFYDNWVEGIKYLLSKSDVKSLTAFAKNGKTPLAIFADKQNISLVPVVVEALSRIKNTSPLDCVYRGSSAYDNQSFLQYIIGNKYKRLMNSLYPFLAKDLINTKEMNECMEKWDESEPKPAFFRLNAKVEESNRELTKTQWITPSPFQTPYADLKDSQFYEATYVIDKVHQLYDLVKPLRDGLGQLDVTKIRSIEKYPDYLMHDFNFCTKYTPGPYLEEYFKYVEDNFMEEVNWVHQASKDSLLIKGPCGRHFNTDFLEKFGIVLAHIGFAGSRARIPFLLDPLIYRVLLSERPEQRLDKEKELYIMAVNPKVHLDYTNKLLNDPTMNIQKEKAEEIRLVWGKIPDDYIARLYYIKKGFIAANSVNGDNPYLLAFKKFIKIAAPRIDDLTKPGTPAMNIPSLKLWFEGIRGVDQRAEKDKIYWCKRFKFSYAKEKNQIVDEEEVKKSISHFIRIDETLLEKLIISLFGVTGTLPFQNRICTFMFKAKESSLIEKIMPEGQLVMPPPETNEELVDLIEGRIQTFETSRDEFRSRYDIIDDIVFTDEDYENIFKSERQPAFKL